MMRYRVLVVMFVLILHVDIVAKAICIKNTSVDTLDTQKTQTNNSITKKQEELKKAIDKYKEALEKKKEMMTKLWKTTMKIEELMKQNQILRKETIKHWKDLKSSGKSH